MPVRAFLSHVGAWPESSLSKCNKFSPSESWTICTSQTSFELVLDYSIHANTLILNMTLLMKSTACEGFQLHRTVSIMNGSQTCLQAESFENCPSSLPLKTNLHKNFLSTPSYQD